MPFSFTYEAFLEASQETTYYSATEHCYRRALKLMYSRSSAIGMDAPVEGRVCVQKFRGYWFVYVVKNSDLFNFEKFDTIREAYMEVFHRVTGTAYDTKRAIRMFDDHLDIVLQSVMDKAGILRGEEPEDDR